MEQKERWDFEGLLQEAGLRWCSHRTSDRGWDDAGFAALSAAHTTNDLDWNPPPIDHSDDEQILQTLRDFQALCRDLQSREEEPTGGERRTLLSAFGELVQEPYFWGHRVYGKEGEALESLISESSQVSTRDLSAAVVEITYIGLGFAFVCCQWRAEVGIDGWVVQLVRSDLGPWRIKVLTVEAKVRASYGDGDAIQRLLEEWYGFDHTSDPDRFLRLTTGGAHCLDPRDSYLMSRRQVEKMAQPGSICEQFLEQFPLRKFDDGEVPRTAVSDVRPLYLGEDLAVVTHRGQNEGEGGEIYLSNSAAILLRQDGAWWVNFIVFHFSRQAVHSIRDRILPPPRVIEDGPLSPK